MPRRKGSRGGKSGTQGPWTVKEVVELAAKHNLAELEVESGGTRIRVVREHASAPRPELAAAPHVQARTAVAEEGRGNLVTIEAPMVGNEGDFIKEDQVLCIIEAMKLMNEIESKMAGRVAKILVENGQPVEYSQPLFLVEPR